MQGISVELNELIELRRFASKPQHKPKGQGVRNGVWQSIIRGRGMDFAEVRNYQAGDEVRHMEWRVTARTGKPHVKLYQEERERPVIILTDFNPSMYFGTRNAFKSVIAARLAALIAWTAVKEGDRVGGLIFSAHAHREYLPRGREYGALPYLSGLCEFSQKNPGTLDEAMPLSAVLMRSRRVIRPGSTLVIISDCYQLDPDSERHLRRLAEHNLVLLYHICDPLELTPPPPATYALTNGKDELALNTRQPSVEKIWQQDCQRRQNRVAAMCKPLLIQTVTVSGADDLALVLAQTFPRRRHGAL